MIFFGGIPLTLSHRSPPGSAFLFNLRSEKQHVLFPAFSPPLFFRFSPRAGRGFALLSVLCEGEVPGL
uniref:Uncharacterized protein n=1 Tax=Anguilla anguilla TaxID=7936 RepID=A0A0E9XT04_ANGAN